MKKIFANHIFAEGLIFKNIKNSIAENTQKSDLKIKQKF